MLTTTDAGNVTQGVVRWGENVGFIFVLIASFKMKLAGGPKFPSMATKDRVKGFVWAGGRGDPSGRLHSPLCQSRTYPSRLEGEAKHETNTDL